MRILIALLLLSSPALAEESLFDLPGGGGVEFVITLTEPNVENVDRQANGEPRIWYVMPLTPTAQVGAEVKGRYDIDEGEYVGTQFRVGVRKRF